MKICMFCGEMISPHPLHKTEKGICATCTKEHTGIDVEDEIDTGRPKMRGKHMVIKKSQAQILMEKRQKELGKKFY